MTKILSLFLLLIGEVWASFYIGVKILAMSVDWGSITHWYDTPYVVTATLIIILSILIFIISLADYFGE